MDGVVWVISGPVDAAIAGFLVGLFVCCSILKICLVRSLTRSVDSIFRNEG